jgi:integrase
MPKITKRLVEALKAETITERRITWDTEIKGFGLLSLPTGVHSFIYDYRNQTGQKRRATIGKYGTLMPEQARDIAETWAAEVKKGGDPLAAKQAKRESLTVSALLDRYLASAKFAAKSDTARPIDTGRITHHLKPLLGKLLVEALTQEHIRRAFNAIRDGQTQKEMPSGKPRGVIRVRGGATAARDCIIVLRTALNWAVTEGLIQDHPASSFKLPGGNTRQAFLEDHEQYARLFAALDQLEEEHAIRSSVADAFRLMALTGARPTEITRCQWQHVNLKTGVISLPPSRHKTGKATGRNRTITLPPVALEIIARQPPGPPEAFVFPASRGDGPITYRKDWVQKIRPAAGLPEDLVPYSLRHSVASHLALGGAQAAQLMAAMGHSQLSTTQRYIHVAETVRTELAERAALPAMAGMRAARKGG